MKNLILLTLSLFIGMSTFAQHPLSQPQKARAHKKAMAETLMYKKKNFRVVNTSKSMQALIEGFYQDVYQEYKPGQRVYVWAMGLAKAPTQEKAIHNALAQAKKHIPGLMLMYFNSWTSANSELSGTDKKLLTNAINQSKEGLTHRIMASSPDKQINLVKSKKGQYQAAVRVLYKQLPLRNIARFQIKKELKRTTQWSEKKMDRLLHFEK
jgi:flavin-binding protein dodecin